VCGVADRIAQRHHRLVHAEQNCPKAAKLLHGRIV
jgi:hypothetical protein